MSMKMRPNDFTMWLRGVLETVGEGKPIPAETSQRIYDQLTEVVAGQVASRFEKQPPETEGDWYKTLKAQPTTGTRISTHT